MRRLLELKENIIHASSGPRCERGTKDCVGEPMTCFTRQCIDCHSEEGILNYEKLGYDEERAEMLRNLPEADYFLKNYK